MAEEADIDICDKSEPTQEELKRRLKLQNALYEQGCRIIENRRNAPLVEEDLKADEWVH